MSKKLRLFIGALAASIALTVVGFPAAVQAQENLVNVEGTDMVMPGPGRSSEWTMSITRVSPKVVSLGLSFVAASATKQSMLNLLTVSIVDERGKVVLQPTLLSELGSDPVSLGQLSGSDLVLTGTLALNASADNQYQAVDGALDFQVIATADDEKPSDPDYLTRTGTSDSVWWGAFGLLVLAGGSALVGISLRRKQS